MAGCDCLTFWGFIPVTAVRADWFPFSFEVGLGPVAVISLYCPGRSLL